MKSKTNSHPIFPEIDEINNLIEKLNFFIYWTKKYIIHISEVLDKGRKKRWTYSKKAQEILEFYKELQNPFKPEFKIYHSKAIHAHLELNLEKLSYNHKEYSIEWLNHSDPKVKIIYPYRKMICFHNSDNTITPSITNIYPHKMIDYYEDFLKNLKYNHIFSDDLMDQLFVLFIIKRTQDGDEKALEKLLKILHHKIISTSEVFLKQLDELGKNYQITKNDIIDTATQITKLLITGDHPSQLIKLINPLNFDYDLFLNRLVAKTIVNSAELIIPEALEWINVINDQLNKLSITQKRNEINYRIENIQLAIDSFLIKMNPFYWLNPYAKNKEYEFNSQMYRQLNGANIVSYLFGTKKTNNKGALWNRLRDWKKHFKSIQKKEFDENNIKQATTINTNDSSSNEFENMIFNYWIEQTNPKTSHQLIIECTYLDHLTSKETEEATRVHIRTIQRVKKAFEKWKEDNSKVLFEKFSVFLPY